MSKVTKICVSLLALGAPAAAFAAEPGAPLTDQAQAGDTAAPTAAPGKIEEVVVTAQKRSENAQKVPIAISVITEKNLEAQHITGMEDLPALLPGLKVGNSAGSGLVYLRGTGQNSGAPGIVNPISTYLDGIYIGIARLGLFDLPAVSQIALLKGPQGSLFGRNASGGIIQVATKDPSSKSGGNVQLGYGNFGTVNGAVYATGSLSDTVAANISFKGRRQSEGEITNVYTGTDLLKERSYSAQSKVRWTPNEDTTVLLNAAVLSSRDMRGVVNGPLPGYTANDGVTTYLGEDKVRLRYDPHSKVDTKLLSLKVTYDLGWAEVSNLLHGLSSETLFKDLQGSGHAGRPNPNNQPDQHITAPTKIMGNGDDLQISSTGSGPFKWIAGLSYEYERTDSTFAVYADEALISNTIGRVTSDAMAEFAQVTYALAPTTRVTGGLRYTTDKLTFSGVNTVTGQTSAGLAPSTTYNQMTWRAAIDHDLTRKILLYAAANRGFKAGQYNITSVTNPPVKPEIVDGVEAGFKSMLFDFLRLNTAFFQQKSSNIQLRSNQAGSVILFNAAKAKTAGVDLDFDAALSDHWSIKGGFEWLPTAKYTSFPNASAVLPSPLTVIPANCKGTPSTVKGGTVNLVCDLTDYRMIFAAKLAATLGVQYKLNAFGGKAEINVGDGYSTRYYIDPNASTFVDPRHVLNASAVWMSPDDKWNVRLWGTNLTNAKTGFRGFAYIPGSPLRFGVEVGMNL
ncbi:TonB-dependent receptor [Massilia sp. LXY-6]|uniref:TonB-dependent receptor n=1 Tax=Massilia sp. LXY-6 TaxID=3379823 RepID=UPI003EDF3AB3